MNQSAAFISMINSFNTASIRSSAKAQAIVDKWKAGRTTKKKERISKVDFIKSQQKPIEQPKENKKLKFIQGKTK